MKKLGKILLIALISLVALLLLLWVGLWIARAIAYNDYVSHKEAESKIPALKDGLVPQGLAYADEDVYLHSGYNGAAMEIHVVIGKDAKEISVYLKPEESKAYYVADGEESEMDVFFC